MTISDIIKSTQACGDKLKIQVESSFEKFQSSREFSTKTSVDNTTEPNGKNHSIQFVALGLIALGIVGWLSTDSDSIWPKLSVGGGVILSAYGMLKGRGKEVHNYDAITKQSNPQLSKQDVQQKIKDIIKNAINEWDKFTKSKKSILMSLIDDSSASTEDKFVATNIVSLSRKIQFSILPYVVKIVNSKSVNELNIVIGEIQKALIDDISNTVAAQISDYQTIADKICHD